MADITKTNHKGLGLPKHFDPSMEQMKKNMEVIDDILQKAVPNDLTSISDANAEPSINALTETGRYLVKSNATGYPVAGYAGVVDVFRAGTYILQEWRSINSPTYVYRRYSTNTGSSWGGWVKDWNANNDGSGSSLDADLLDGLHSSSFFRVQGTTSNFNSATSEGKWRITNTTNAPYTGCTDWVCIVYQLDGGTSELYQLAYEECTNQPTSISGGTTSSYSTGIPLMYVRKRINGTWYSWQCLWHSGNDGSGSGLNADLLDGLHASSFRLLSEKISPSEIDSEYDVIITSKSDWDTMVASENWGGVKKVGIATNIGGVSGWDSANLDIVIPDNVEWFGRITKSFDALTSNKISCRVWCRSLTGHSGCTIDGLEICLDPYAGSYNSTLTSDVYLMSNFGVVNNCSISIGNHHQPSSILPENSGRIYGVYNCATIYNSIISDSGVSSSATGFNNITYVAHSRYLLNVRVHSWNNAYSRETSVGFYNCISLIGCIYILSTASSEKGLNNTIFAGFYKCSNLSGCSVRVGSSSSYSSTLSGNILLKGCQTITDLLVKCPYEEATYSLDVIITDCKDILSYTNASENIITLSFDGCSKPYIPTVLGGTYDNPTIINEQTELPCIIKDGYSAFVNPETGTVLKKYYPHEPVMVLGYDGELIDTDGDLFFEGSNPIGSFMVLSGNSTEIQYYKIDTQADTLEITGYFEKLLEKDGTGSKLDSDLLDGYEGSAYLRIANLLTEIKGVDGSGSGLDTDLLDGQHEYQMAKYGTASGSFLTTGDPTATNTGGCQMYRFQDSSNLIGEGSSRYYGVIQIYYSASYYIRIAVSMTSGKVYRQTSSQTAWNEITPKVPVVTEDPTSPSEGQLWILTD